MGVRAWLNENPRVVTVAVGAAVFVVGAFVVMQLLGGRRAYPNEGPQTYFSADDGKTYFQATSDNIAPWAYQGKQAVAAHVYECPQCGPKNRFVGYVERWTPAGRKAIAEKQMMTSAVYKNRELKRPGAAEWTSAADAAAVSAITTEIKCPKGHAGAPEPVEP